MDLLSDFIEVDKDPAGVEIVHELELECYSVTGTAKKDFGPWTRGDHGHFVLNVFEGKLTQYNNLGNVVHEVDVCLCRR